MTNRRQPEGSIPSEVEAAVGKRLYRVAETLIDRAVSDPRFRGDQEITRDVFDSTAIVHRDYSIEGSKRAAKKLGVTYTGELIPMSTMLSVWDGVELGGDSGVKGSSLDVTKHTLGGISLWEDDEAPGAENRTTYVTLSKTGKIDGKVIRNEKDAKLEPISTEAAAEAAFRILAHARGETSKQRAVNKSEQGSDKHDQIDKSVA